MTRVTFKQFNAFLEAPIEEEQLDEIFGIFKSKEQKEKAERTKIELLAKKGNLTAKAQLRKLELDAEKKQAAHGASKELDQKKDEIWKRQAVGTGPRTPSAKGFSKNGDIDPRWNRLKGEWERYDTTTNRWVSTGNKDQWAGTGEKRGGREPR